MISKHMGGEILHFHPGEDEKPIIIGYPA